MFRRSPCKCKVTAAFSALSAVKDHNFIFDSAPASKIRALEFSRRLSEPISFLKKNIDIAKLLYYYLAKSEGVIS